jgi:hypothetical protein
MQWRILALDELPPELKLMIYEPLFEISRPLIIVYNPNVGAKGNYELLIRPCGYEAHSPPCRSDFRGPAPELFFALAATNKTNRSLVMQIVGKNKICMSGGTDVHDVKHRGKHVRDFLRAICPEARGSLQNFSCSFGPRYYSESRELYL